MESKTVKEEYQKKVDALTPENDMLKDVSRAFLVGGLICLMGQVWKEIFLYLGMSQEDALGWTTLVLILESVLMTGLGLYQKLAKFGGAGTLVPITGFANGVVSPAIEFQTEGQIFGVGSKIFTIAGPVILYGIFSSWILGVIYLVLKTWGIV